jgi:biotin carboxyl carrier protein
MKMENNILSEKDGVVKSIKVAVGNAVMQEDVLMELE